LIARFGAVSLFPQNVHGIWVHEGVRYEDESMRLVVDVDDASENQDFLIALKPTLLERFEQIEIYIASYPVDIL
jgi:hypothetical protein